MKDEKGFPQRICQSQFRIIERYNTYIYSVAIVSYPSKGRGDYYDEDWDLKAGVNLNILIFLIIMKILKRFKI